MATRSSTVSHEMRHSFVALPAGRHDIAVAMQHMKATGSGPQPGAHVPSGMTRVLDLGSLGAKTKRVAAVQKNQGAVKK